MRLPLTEARAFVFGPRELAEILVEQFSALGVRAERAPTPQNEDELYSWLSAHRVVDAASESESEGSSAVSVFIHPGLSFWADRPEFPQIVSSAGFFPVTPNARTLSLCLNKLNVLVEAEAAGIPHLAVALDPLSSLREIEATLERTGERYPIVLKSLKVAQGHGILVVQDQAHLREIVPGWFEQLSKRYGEASVLIERCLASARHLVVPFAADGEGFLEIFPPLDATLQTRWRRMIQFIPAIDVDAEAAKAVELIVRKWVAHVGFRGFGSVEFLVDGGRVYLIDANARLNAAFPLWEGMLGMRTLEWQLGSLGEIPLPARRLSELPPTEYGAGISLRFYAEDPIRQLPCPGFVRHLTPPANWNEGEVFVRWMTRYRAGQEIPWTSTGVIGELFLLGPDRKATLAAARKVLRKIWIAGSVKTNQRFLLEHLEHPFVKENLIHAGFTDEDFVPQAFPSQESVREFVTIANTLLPSPGARWVVGNQWVEPDSAFAELNSTALAGATRFHLGEGSTEQEGAFGIIGSGENALPFHLEPTQPDRWLMSYGTWTLNIRRVKPHSKAAAPLKQRKILALATGRIHALLRQTGETLQAHERACMIESLGILVPHAVPLPARIIEWKVSPGAVVEAGHELAVVELLG